jgi:hypothetical protein
MSFHILVAGSRRNLTPLDSKSGGFLKVLGPVTANRHGFDGKSRDFG